MDTIKVGNQYYSEEQLLIMVQYYNQNHKPIPPIFENESILHNIALQSDINSTSKLLRINKQFNTLNDQFLWKEKLEHDYPLVHPKSNNWENEYKSIHEAHQRATQFIEVLKMIKRDEGTKRECIGFGELYMNHHNKDVNYDKLYMLPDIIKNKLPATEKPNINFIIDYVQKKYVFKIILEGKIGRKRKEIISATYNYNDYVDFFTYLLYKYPNIIIGDGDEIPFLYNPYESEPLEPIEEWVCIKKYWEKSINNLNKI